MGDQKRVGVKVATGVKNESHFLLYRSIAYTPLRTKISKPTDSRKFVFYFMVFIFMFTFSHFAHGTKV